MNDLPSIKLYNLGSDKDPVTADEVQAAMDAVEKNNGALPKDWPKKHKFSKVPRSPVPGHLLIKIGSSNRPATEQDIADIMEQIKKAVQDPDLTIVTHHNLELQWIPDGVRTGIIRLEPEKEEVAGVQNDN